LVAKRMAESLLAGGASLPPVALIMGDIAGK
jgi:hypothetical protein